MPVACPPGEHLNGSGHSQVFGHARIERRHRFLVWTVIRRNDPPGPNPAISSFNSDVVLAGEPRPRNRYSPRSSVFVLSEPSTRGLPYQVGEARQG